MLIQQRNLPTSKKVISKRIGTQQPEADSLPMVNIICRSLFQTTD